MKKLAWLAVALAVVLGVAFAQDLRSPRENAETELVFFFSDSTKELESAARALRALRTRHQELRIRPVFLAEDFGAIAKPTDDFAAGLRELKYAVGENFSVSIYDEEGLALARRFKIDRLPAFAIVVTAGERRKACVAYGSRANLEELLKCGK